MRSRSTRMQYTTYVAVIPANHGLCEAEIDQVLSKLEAKIDLEDLLWTDKTPKVKSTRKRSGRELWASVCSNTEDGDNWHVEEDWHRVGFLGNEDPQLPYYSPGTAPGQVSHWNVPFSVNQIEEWKVEEAFEEFIEDREQARPLKEEVLKLVKELQDRLAVAEGAARKVFEDIDEKVKEMYRFVQSASRHQQIVKRRA